MSTSAEVVIQQLGLQPHPEGGWYRETWRGPQAGGGCSVGTAIHYLLQRHQRSHWHRIDASELWLYQAGGPLNLRKAVGGHVIERRLGPDLTGGDLLQEVVAPGEWQAAHTDADWALVACVVMPGFEFSKFELAPPEWRPAGA